MGVYRERMERPVSGPAPYRARLSPAERSRLERWGVKTCARVIHPTRGTVVVPHRSNYAAILNAAEVWGCDWLEIRDAQVLRPEPGDTPVPMPHII